MKRKRLLLGLIFILLGLLASSIVLAHSVPYSEKREILLDTSFDIEGGEHEKFRGFYLSAPAEDVIISISVSEGFINFSVWHDRVIEDSLGYFDYHNGTGYEKIQVWLFSVDNGDLSWSPKYNPESLNKIWYVQFSNPDSYEKEVDLKVTKIWHEPVNPMWMMGVAFMTIGTGIGLHTDKFKNGVAENTTPKPQKSMSVSKKLLSGYAILGTVIGVILGMSISFSLTTLTMLQTEPDLILHLLLSVPFVLLLLALPSSAITYLWLKKGGGLFRLRSWNMGKWSRISATLLLSGYVLATIPLLASLLSNWGFLYNPNNGGFNLQYFNTIYIGSAVMVCGLAVFISLGIRHLIRRRATATPSSLSLS
jgi:F0F1-type ATP synthase membrane subunit c/vacuolar-type H+-ATPase subunit K